MFKKITARTVEKILADETEPRRFEAVANAVVSAVEGAPVLNTSLSYDAGRDGRGIGAADGVFVCSTLDPS